MKHIKALGIKFAFTALTLLLFFAVINNVTIWEVLIVAALVTGLSYLLGDLFVLPKYGYVTSVLADLILAFISVWLLGLVFISGVGGMNLVASAIYSAMILTFCEALFHYYMGKRVVTVKSSETPEEWVKKEHGQKTGSLLHARAAGIKVVFTTVILLIFFTVLDTATIGETLLISILFIIVSYVVGDLLILPRFGHLVAAIADLFLAFLIIWLAGLIFISNLEMQRLILGAGISAMLLTICESLLHSHLSNNVLKVKGHKSPEQRNRDEREKQKQPGNEREKRAQERGIEDREK